MKFTCVRISIWIRRATNFLDFLVCALIIATNSCQFIHCLASWKMLRSVCRKDIFKIRTSSRAVRRSFINQQKRSQMCRHARLTNFLRSIQQPKSAQFFWIVFECVTKAGEKHFGCSVNRLLLLPTHLGFDWVERVWRNDDRLWIQKLTPKDATYQKTLALFVSGWSGNFFERTSIFFCECAGGIVDKQIFDDKIVDIRVRVNLRASSISIKNVGVKHFFLEFGDFRIFKNRIVNTSNQMLHVRVDFIIVGSNQHIQRWIPIVHRPP